METTVDSQMVQGKQNKTKKDNEWLSKCGKMLKGYEWRVLRISFYYALNFWVGLKLFS